MRHLSWVGLSLATLVASACALNPNPRESPGTGGAATGAANPTNPTDPTNPASASPSTGHYPLAGIDPRADDGDLAPFAKSIAGADLVGLGESVHGSAGFHRARRRLIQHMIERLGFRAVALETPWIAADVATQYIGTCVGSPDDAMRSFFPAFRAAEMRDLLTWICDFNRAHPDDKVSFFGFDDQELTRHGVLLRAFVSKVLPAEATPINKALRVCANAKYETDAEWTNASVAARSVREEDYAPCLKAIDDLSSRIDREEAAFNAAAGVEAVQSARVALIGLRAEQISGYHLDVKDDLIPALTSRDDAIAKILLRVRELRAPGRKTAVIAHNTHLALGLDRLRSAEFVGWPSMGQHLRAAPGVTYRAIALTAPEVSVVVDGRLPLEPDGNSIEQRTKARGAAYAFVDLAEATRANGFLSDRPTYGLYLDATVESSSVVPLEQFDGVVYLASSEAMRIVP